MSMFSNLSCDDVQLLPFPHLVISDAIEPALCDELVKQFPPLDRFTKGRDLPDNTKIHLPALKTLDDSSTAQVWRDFLKDQISGDAWHHLARIFARPLLAEYPDFENRFAAMSAEHVGIRGIDDFVNHRVLLDAQMSIHTPVKHAPCVDRGPHLKTRDKPFEAYLLLRHDDDHQPGCDFDFYSLRPDIQPEFGPSQVVDPLMVKLEKSVTYKKNVLIVLLNTKRSIQGFSLRPVSDYPLMYFNFNASVSGMLYDIPGNWTLFQNYKSEICANRVRPPGMPQKKAGFSKLRHLTRGSRNG